MDRDQQAILIIAARTIGFATDHPYAATGIFGAAVGSAVTYKVMTRTPKFRSVSDIFTPKVYELAIPKKDLQALLDNPTAELRWVTPELTVIVTAEKPERLKELPFIDVEVE